MRYFKFSKLVRDKIVDQMFENKLVPHGVRTLDDSEYVQELVKKVIEEANEMEKVKNIEDLKQELADLLEVIDYLQKALKTNDEEIKSYQRKKIDENGGFDKKIYLEYVEADTNNKWVDYYLKNPDKYPEIKVSKN